jgi:putative transposase
MNEVGRRKPAQGVRIEAGQPTILFLTVCAVRPATWLATEVVPDSLVKIWREADGWMVGNYLLMPDHLHLFCGPRDLQFTAEKWVEFWKRQFSREHRNSEWVWQRSCFHHRLWSEVDYAEKLQYVRENPVRKGLVERAEGWQFGGCVEELRW